jgi:hypothetical protein
MTTPLWATFFPAYAGQLTFGGDCVAIDSYCEIGLIRSFLEISLRGPVKLPGIIGEVVIDMSLFEGFDNSRV